MDSLLVISLSESRRDPRVARHLETLRGRYLVDVAGYGEAPEGAHRFIRLPRRLSPGEKIRGLFRLAARRYDSFYWKNRRMRFAREALRGSAYRLVLANDVDTLPLALAVAGSAPVLLDAHEYAPLQFEDRWLWRTWFQPYVEDLCRRHLGQVRGMLTVSQGIAGEYARCFGVHPAVLTNATDLADLVPGPVDPSRVRLVHHGGATPSRRLEEMVAMFRFLDERFHLDFMLVPSDPRYLRRLKKAAAFCPRIRFVEPVPMPDIPRALNGYDVGLYLLPPVNYNHLHALPNKFFEYVMAQSAYPEVLRILVDAGIDITNVDAIDAIIKSEEKDCCGYSSSIAAFLERFEILAPVMYRRACNDKSSAAESLKL